MYTFYIREFLMEFDDEFYKTNLIKIHSIDGKFEQLAVPLKVRVTDGTTTVDSILQNISGNGKTIAAFFTVDAFSGFAGNVDIEFGHAPNYETFTAVDINTIILPLNPLSTGVTHLIADNAWLASL